MMDEIHKISNKDDFVAFLNALADDFQEHHEVKSLRQSFMIEFLIGKIMFVMR